MWAAYRKGSFEGKFPKGLTADAFIVAFEQYVLAHYDAVWTLFAKTKMGVIPVGLVFGFWPHSESHEFMIGDAFIWFEWASARIRVETAVGFFNKVRNEIPMVFFVRPQNKKFYEMIAQHGLTRRIGTSMNVFAGESASVWETRKNG